MRVLRNVVLASMAVLGVAAPSASAFPSTGPQRLLVIPVEYAHTGCPSDAQKIPTCPRNTAAQLQTMFTAALTPYFDGPATGHKLTWTVRVLANPATADGWWPAPSTVQALTAAATAAGKSFNNFTWTPSPVGDAARTVLGRAIDAGVISPAEAASYTRFATIHNWHTFGGQTYPAGQPAFYVTPFTGPKGPAALNLLMTASFVNEGTGNQEMVNVLEHELGHQLGVGDLYGRPCAVVAPDDPPPPLGGYDCTGFWDVMSYTPSGGSNTAFSYWSRAILGWVDTYPPATRYETGAFTGHVALSSIEYPDGDPLALHFPDDPGRLVLARAFGQGTYFKGFLVECRRTPVDDPIGPSNRGVTISFIDSSLLGNNGRGQIYAHAGFTKAFGNPFTDFTETFLRPGDSWSSASRGLNVEFTGFDGKGGCDLFVNRAAPIQRTTTLLPAVPANDPTSVHALGGTTSQSVHVNPGLVVNVPRLPLPRIARDGRLVAPKATRIGALQRGRSSTIRFAYGNAGGKTGGGTAVVRVQQPWIASPDCGTPAPPAGRIVARVQLKALAPGASGVATARWTPRSTAPAFISVTFVSPGTSADEATATTVLAFQTHRRRAHRSTREQRTKILVKVPRTCKQAVSVAVTPQIIPKGWGVRLLGADQRFTPGVQRTVTLVVRAPKGRRAASATIPVGVSFGAAASGPAEGPDLLFPIGDLPPLSQTVGVDVLARASAPGQSAPGFVLAAPAGLKGATATSPVVEPNTGAPDQAQTIAIGTCAVPPGGVDAAVSGTLTPLRPNTTVTLTYTGTGGPQMGQVVTQTTITDAVGGAFSDQFSPGMSTWSVTAHVGPAVDIAAGASAACALP